MSELKFALVGCGRIAKRHAELLGHRQIANARLIAFLRLVPAEIQAIATAIDAGQPSALKSHAHRLKGSSSAIGATQMARLCAALESAEDSAHDVLKQLDAEHQRVRSALLAEVASTSGR